MIVDEDIYLEHFGVKGMHWGVRRQGTPAQKRAGNRRFARNLVLGGAVGVAGGLAVASILKRKGMVPVKEFQKLPDFNKIFSASMPLHKNFYGKHAEEAFRKAGAFGAIPLGPIGSTSIARLNGAIPIPRVR